MSYFKEILLVKQLTVDEIRQGGAGSSGLSWSGNFTAASNVRLGSTSTVTVGFWTTAGVSQPAGASQGAFSTAAPVSITASQYGFSTSTQIQSILNFLVEVRSALVRTGFIAGA